MKQSAVEWLVANIDWQLLKNTSLHYEMVVEKAKEMERQQIIDAYVVDNGDLIEHSKPMAEQYYKKTFKKTVLVTYKEYQDAPHPLLDGEWLDESKVVYVSDLTDLNNMFKRIINVKIID
jgi:predicted nucleotidyltransferase